MKAGSPEFFHSLARPRLNPWVAAVFLLVYVLLDRISYLYPVAPLGITPWNPPPGLSVFLLLRFGLGYWPCVLVAPIAADLFVRGEPVAWLAPALSAATTAGGYCAAAWVLRERLYTDISLSSARALQQYFLALVPASLLVAAAYVGIYTGFGAVERGDYWNHLLKFWIGDLNGLLVLTPVLLVHLAAPPAWRDFSRLEWLEVAAQTAALGGALAVIFIAGSDHGFRLFYPLFLPLVWIASRWGLRGATLALAGIQLGLIAAVQAGGYGAATFVQLQAVMLVLCVTGLVLGAVVTHRSQVEAQLRERQDALNRALRFAAAGEMSSALAHELNQPMAALSAYLGACQKLLHTPGGSERLAETLSKAEAESHRASEVIQAIRAFFKGGGMRPQMVDPELLLNRAVESIKGRCAQQGIRLLVQVQRPLRPLSADALQIETALHNLLTNAADALLGGGVAEPQIVATVRGDQDGVYFQIDDNGPGVTPAMSDRLFEPFQSSKADGMGLGLSISRTLVEAHGGSLRWNSPAPGGSFRLFLPYHEEGAGP